MMEPWQKIQTAFRFFGTKITLQTIQYSLLRDWLTFRYRRRSTQSPPRAPGKMGHFTPHKHGGQIAFEHAELEVVFLSERLVRIHWSPGTVPLPYAIEPLTWPEPRVQTEDTTAGLTLATAELQLTVSEDGAIRFSDGQGVTLRQELPPVRQGEAWTQPGLLASEERLYGLGERAAPFNLRGGKYRLKNEDPGGSYGPASDPLYMTIPVYIGLHQNGSYLIFYENPFPGEISFQAQATARFEAGTLRYYFISGPPDRALETYTALTGCPPLPPRWALGYHQSRWGYTGEDQVRDVVEGFRRHELPLDALHLDIDYMDGFRLFTVDKNRFPNLPELAKDLNQQGIRLVTILDCGVKEDPGYHIYDEGLKRDYFLKNPDGKPARALVWPGWSVFPDFTNETVRSWWGAQYQTLLDAGAAGVWHDMNEPATFSAWGEPTLSDVTRHTMEGRGGDHREAHNLYALLMGKAGFEALKSLQPEKRPWLLTRSGWAGIQKYAWHWTGDTDSSWEMLEQTVPSLLGLALSGISFSGPDIGGFSGSPSPELFLRWFQLAAFVPFFRNHAAVGTPPREPYRFKPDIVNILRDFLKMRRRLLPYLYTLAWEASQTGQPLMRPLFWHDPSDPDLWDLADSFLMGRDLLVAPIFKPGNQVRSQRLPAGDWFSFWDDTLYHGPGVVDIHPSLKTIPVFVRAGSVIPMLAPGEENHTDPALALHLYPDPEATISNRLYSDAGEGYGDWRVDRFQLVSGDGAITLEWHQEAGEFLFPYPKIILYPHGFAPEKVWIDGELLSPGSGPLEVGFFESIRMANPGAEPEAAASNGSFFSGAGV